MSISNGMKMDSWINTVSTRPESERASTNHFIIKVNCSNMSFTRPESARAITKCGIQMVNCSNKSSIKPEIDKVCLCNGMKTDS